MTVYSASDFKLHMYKDVNLYGSFVVIDADADAVVVVVVKDSFNHATKKETS